MGKFIKLGNVTLRFRRYHNPSPALKESFVNSVSGRQKQIIERKDFVALNDITLRIEEGERVGLIGLNGAGKSTLLKTIVGIYSPQEGEIEVGGTITPLIELGTGFDPELSGRENIYLNGAMLGRSKAQMQQYEQQIIEFAELNDFIDQPIKYYSSGMTARLAYGIGTVLEPEILLVDEIFSTGDARFVGKAMSRMTDLLNTSQIVIMASHNIEQVKQTCTRVVLLDRGRIVKDGDPKEVTDFYLEQIVQIATTSKKVAAEEPSIDADDSNSLDYSPIAIDPDVNQALIVHELHTLRKSKECFIDELTRHKEQANILRAELDMLARNQQLASRLIDIPLVLISHLQYSGGTLLAKLFDGHSQCLSYGHELYIGHPDKSTWPRLPLEGTEQDWWDILKEKAAYRQFREGAKISPRSNPERSRMSFSLVPYVQRKIFSSLARGAPISSSREVLNCYLTSYFTAWVDYHNSVNAHLAKFVTAFVTRMHFDPTNIERFFEDYPDGFVIIPIREPGDWFAAARAKTTGEYSDAEASLALWKRSTESALRLRGQFSDKVKIITFDRLKTETEAIMRSIANDLGLDFEPVLLHPTFNGIPCDDRTSESAGNTEHIRSRIPSELEGLYDEVTRMQFALHRPTTGVSLTSIP